MTAALAAACVAGILCRDLVGLGDSWAMLDPLHLPQATGCPIAIRGAQGGRTISELLLDLPRLEPRIRLLPGPVLVYLIVGINDRVSGKDHWPIGLLIDVLVKRLNAIRPDLTVLHVSYNGHHGEEWLEHIRPRPLDDYKRVDLHDLDSAVEWKNYLHVTRESHQLRVETLHERELSRMLACPPQEHDEPKRAVGDEIPTVPVEGVATDGVPGRGRERPDDVD